MLSFILYPLLATAYLSPWPFDTDDIRQTQTDDPRPKRPGLRKPVFTLYNHRSSEQTFIGAHDNIASRTADDGWLLSGNRYYNVSVQLQSGVRLLQAQGHSDPNGSNEIRLCHFNCALMDGGSFHDHLLTVRQLLDAHPYDLVTLLFVNVVCGGLLLWMKAYYDAGLDLLPYIPPPDKHGGIMYLNDRPTIAEMVATNQRVVTFLSSGANEDIAPYLLNQFDYMFETDFGIEAPWQYNYQPARPRWPGSYIPPRLRKVSGPQVP